MDKKNNSMQNRNEDLQAGLLSTHLLLIPCKKWPEEPHPDLIDLTGRSDRKDYNYYTCIFSFKQDVFNVNINPLLLLKCLSGEINSKKSHLNHVTLTFTLSVLTDEGVLPLSFFLLLWKQIMSNIIWH